ncbi:MAG: hypothetical protein M3186_03760, partial [Actinomycetota bacterium]|nr:hypothetical protein [Actinomycetota bacterium]
LNRRVLGDDGVYPEMMDGFTARIRRWRRRMIISSQPARPDQNINVSHRRGRPTAMRSSSTLALAVDLAIVYGALLVLMLSPNQNSSGRDAYISVMSLAYLATRFILVWPRNFLSHWKRLIRLVQTPPR